uniref:Uncharacterized protein n=1 Tax=Cannabis sativa TaxID=3483 RepID=A0A803NLP2_CANSA
MITSYQSSSPRTKAHYLEPKLTTSNCSSPFQTKAHRLDLIFSPTPSSPTPCLRPSSHPPHKCIISTSLQRHHLRAPHQAPSQPYPRCTPLVLHLDRSRDLHFKSSSRP